MASRFAVYATVAVAASVALLAAALVLVPKLTTSATGQPEAKRIIAFELKYNYSLGKAIMETHPVKVTDMRPNSAVTILDPFSKDMAQYYRDRISSEPQEVKEAFIQKAEPYSVYALVRLPDWLGGAKDDISSYRAYSIVSVSNSCMARYFEADGRWALEEPCEGSRYRPWDGLGYSGPVADGISGNQIVGRAEPVALSTLTLSVDDKGYIVAAKSTADANGVVGQGRKVTFAGLEKGDREMLAAASSYASYELPFKPRAGSYHLAALMPGQSTRDTVAGRPVPFSATYFDYAVGGRRAQLEATAYPVDAFPGMALDLAKDPPFNATAMRPLADLGSEGQVRSGPAVAGQYAYLVQGDDSWTQGVAWIKGPGGRDFAVVFRGYDVSLDALESVARALAGPD